MRQRKLGPMQVANGHRDTARSGIKVVCLFDDDLFSDVKDRAIDRGISFAQSVRELVNAGFLYEEDET